MLKLTTTQLKVVPGKTTSLDEYVLPSVKILANEPFSFQAVYWCDCSCLPVTVDINTDLPVETYRIDCVPVTNAANDYQEPGYVTDEPGMLPDLLEPRPAKPQIFARDGAWGGVTHFEEQVDHTLNASKAMQSILVTLNPEGQHIAAGNYSVTVTVRAMDTLHELATECLTVQVIEAELPAQDFCVTNWFHVDCLCEFYGCEPYSERFYEIFKTFLRNMTRHRQNTLLIPAFTPALDTPIGHARRNVQLVDIDRLANGWHFDFTRLAVYMKTAAVCGIRYFEHCHLFSQWGATKTPNIYDRDGKLLFGWDTDAAGAEYVEFIRSYLKAFIDFAHGEGYTKDQLIFHISDEPTEEMLEGYTKAHDAVADLIASYQHIDALSSVEFYRRGLVKNPVASVEHAESFAAECEGFWVYYTCGTYVKMCTNRLISNTAARTRVLGAQMYKYKAKGFLHWAYNFYFDRMSEGYFDPKVNPCGYKQLPGCSYLAYPERDGAVPSLREVYMREAFDDLRALNLYESLTSREETERLLSETLGQVDVHTIPNGNAMHDFSQRLKSAIEKELSDHR